MQKRKQLRLRNYDYSQNGMYFVTICTQNKKCYFGKIINDEMKLNIVGKIANKYLVDISKYYENVNIIEHVVMPNHIHLIVEICDEVVTEQCSVTTVNGKNYGLLSKIVKSYKNAVTKEINKIYSKNNFNWQRSYYDHIIRKEESLQKIQEYIIINPQEWESDELYNN